MKNILKIALTISLASTIILGCKKKNYFIGGTLHNSVVNMNTYDYLKSNKVFDTLIILIDKGGLKEKINKSGSSFFAPTNYSIKKYLTFRTLRAQRKDPKKIYTIDSLLKYDLDKFKDSINVYSVPARIDFANLTNDGTLYSTAKPGVSAVASFEYTDNKDLGYNSNSANKPQIMYYTFLRKAIATPFVAADISPNDGTRVRIQTSGIETTNGMLHVLSNDHVLYFTKTN